MALDGMTCTLVCMRASARDVGGPFRVSYVPSLHALIKGGQASVITPLAAPAP